MNIAVSRRINEGIKEMGGEYNRLDIVIRTRFGIPFVQRIELIRAKDLGNIDKEEKENDS